MEKSSIPIIGQHKRNINIVPYHPGWVALYELEAARLQEALGEQILAIEHIGSTAIPGMPSKPVIDMMAAVKSLKVGEELIPVLGSLGYEFRFPDIVPERMFFMRESALDVRTHHMNLTEPGSGFWVNQLAFRDYLRGHDEIAQEYVNLKVRLAEDYACTGVLDVDGKSEFVGRVLKRTEADRHAVG